MLIQTNQEIAEHALYIVDDRACYNGRGNNDEKKAGGRRKRRIKVGEEERKEEEKKENGRKEEMVPWQNVFYYRSCRK